jgi:predicted  nucleic acid-binding Zn-ribbon protein
MRRFAPALLATLLAGFVYVQSAPAQAADSCNTTVIDNTSGHVLDQSAINAASKKLDNLGADVRVRAFQTAPTGRLESYYSSQVKACPSWQGPDGLPKSNLVVFAFSMDHQSAIYYGSGWHAGLDSNWERIRADYMNTQFRAGNFTKGITGAEAETYRVLDEQLHPSAASNGGSSASSGVGKAFGYGLLGVLGLAVLIGLIVGSVFLRRRHLRLAAENRQAQHEAVEARNKAATTVGKLDMSGVMISYHTVTTDLNDEDMAALQALLTQAQADYEAAINAESDLSDKAETYDAQRKRATEDYRRITARCDEVASLAAQAQGSIKALDDRCAKLLKDIEQAPTQLTNLLGELTKLTGAEAELKEQGYHLDEAKPLQDVSKLLRTASQQITAKHHGQALDELEHASSLCEEIGGRIDALRHVRGDLQSKRAQLSEALTGAKNSVDRGTATLADLQNGYDSSCWADLPAAQQQAAQALSDAAHALTLVDHLSAMEVQRWDEAAQQLQVAGSAVGIATQFEADVDHVRGNLEELAATLPGAVTQAVGKVQGYVQDLSGMRGEHASAKRKLKGIVSQLEQLQQEVAQPKPAYLRIESDLADKLAKAKKLKNTAKEEHDRIIREEEEEERRRRRRLQEQSSYGNNSFATGIAIGSSLNNGGGYSGGGGFDFGGGGGGGWGGGDAGGGGGGSW